MFKTRFDMYNKDPHWNKIICTDYNPDRKCFFFYEVLIKKKQ